MPEAQGKARRMMLGRRVPEAQGRASVRYRRRRKTRGFPPEPRRPPSNPERHAFLKDEIYCFMRPIGPISPICLIINFTSAKSLRFFDLSFVYDRVPILYIFLYSYLFFAFSIRYCYCLSVIRK